MWVHIAIFAVIAGIGLSWKAGWLHLDGLADSESVRLFLLVAVCGNLLGMLLTLTSGGSQVYTNGHRLEKEITGAYTEEFEVSVDGEDSEKFQIQVPEKRAGKSFYLKKQKKKKHRRKAEKRNLEKQSKSITKKKKTRIIIICRKNGTARNWSGRSREIIREL